MRSPAALLVAMLLPLMTHPARAGGQDVAALQAYTGLFTRGTHHDLVVTVQQAPGMAALLLTDLSSDEVRLLMPVAPDTFAAGNELTRPVPEAFRIAFRRGRDGSIAGFTTLRAGRASAEARRRTIRREVVRFARGELRFEGTLYLPDSSTGPRTRRLPAAVMAHGSEDSGRDSFGALPFVLARRGIAVLAFDKRGTGTSTGDWSSAGLEDLAGDVIAGRDALLARPDIDAARVGIVGVSEGGWVAPLAARLGGRIAFIVAISGGGLTKGAALVYKDSLRAVERGLTGAAMDSALAASRKIISDSRARAVAGQAATGFDKRVTYDPSADWSAFRGSVLSIGGELDVLEDAIASARRLSELLGAAGNTDHVVKVFPKGHHGALFLGRERRPSEAAGFRGVTQVVPGFWDTLSLWIESRYGPRAGV